jgi:hypothetical protein
MAQRNSSARERLRIDLPATPRRQASRLLAHRGDRCRGGAGVTRPQLRCLPRSRRRHTGRTAGAPHGGVHAHVRARSTPPPPRSKRGAYAACGAAHPFPSGRWWSCSGPLVRRERPLAGNRRSCRGGALQPSVWPIAAPKHAKSRRRIGGDASPYGLPATFGPLARQAFGAPRTTFSMGTSTWLRMPVGSVPQFAYTCANSKPLLKFTKLSPCRTSCR